MKFYTAYFKIKNYKTFKTFAYDLKENRRKYVSLYRDNKSNGCWIGVHVKCYSEIGLKIFGWIMDKLITNTDKFYEKHYSFYNFDEFLH